MAELDSNIVERYADHLQRKASSLLVSCTILGGLVGSALGSAPLFSLKFGLIPQHLGYATLLVGTGAGGFLGYNLGLRRGEGHRLQAELVLHQLHVERTRTAPVVAAPVRAAAAPAPPTPPALIAALAPAVRAAASRPPSPLPPLSIEG